MSIGYIKLHRSIIDWQYWDDQNTVRVLIYLLVSVNYEPKKWMGLEINAGQIVTSFDKIAQKTGLTNQQIRRSINILVSCGEITRKTTNKYQLISLVKWEELQHEEKKRTGKTPTKEHSKNNQTTTTKEGKEYKEDNNTNKINLISINKQKFKDDLSPFLSIYGKDLLNDFFIYWTEPNKSCSKMKFEMEKTWSIEMRLARWAKNDKNFKPINNANKQQPTREERNAEYLAKTISALRGEANGNGSKPNNENGSDDFATFEIMQ